jgi:hypothetical protein
MARKRVDKNRLRQKSRNDPSNLYALAGGEAMTNARLRVGVVAFTLVLVVCSTAHAQQIETSSPKANQRVRSLSIQNSGQHLTANVGQQIEITLGTDFVACHPPCEHRVMADNSCGPDVYLYLRGGGRRGAGHSSAYQHHPK